MSQLSLLDAPARRTDPETSREAAASVDAAGLEALVLRALHDLGPSTSREVAEHLGRDLVTVSPRFRPLERKGRVRRTERRRDRATVWEAA